MSVTAGTRFGFYEVLSPIGSGGMGEVYLGHDVRLGRRVALKLLPARFTADNERVRRFQQEARAASALNHPNIITIFEIGQADDTHFIAAEFVEGRTVSQRLNAGKMSQSEVLDVAIQAASAIAAAHAAGIVHRDIKSDNIMIRPDGYVKVLDFGLAKLTETFTSGQTADLEGPTQPLDATSPGMIMGTVNYMSPEQARGYKVDARSDIFSLGIVLYEMLTEKLPFSGASGSDVLAAILTQPAPSLSRYLTNAPPELEWIVGKALAKEREGRFQRADEMVTVLKRVKQQIDFRAERDLIPQPAAITDVGNPQPTVEIEPGQKSSGSYDTNRLFRSEGRAVLAVFKRLAKERRKQLIVGSVMLLLTIAAATYFWQSRRASTMHAIAILPFSSNGSSQDTSLLADGITSGLITSLSRVPKLRVTSLSAVLRYKPGGANATPLDPRTIGRELEVAVMLTGRISEKGDGLTVDLELVDTRDNAHIWGRQYQRKRADLLSLQEEITREVSRRLQLDLNAAEMARFEAFQNYLRGRYFLSKRTGADLRQAVESFDKAISLDPDLALAHAGVADSYNLLGTYGALDPKEAFTKAREAATKALSIDDSLAEAHTALAYLKHRYDWDWPGAEAEFKRAIELDPTYAPARQWYASLLIAMGRTRQAINEARACQELDPLSLIINSHLAWILYLGRRYDEALAHCHKIIALDDNYFSGYRYAGLIYEQLGRHSEAISALNRARELSRGSPVILGALAHANAISGHRDEARRLLEEIKSAAPPRRVSAYEVAVVYTGLDEKELAFVWLEKAYQERNEYLNYLRTDPRFDPLRTDLRYTAMVRKIGLAPEGR